MSAAPQAPWTAPAGRGLHPSAVLCAYLEPLVAGRRVAVLGDATLGLAEALAARGARLVHAYDPERARVAEAIARGGRGPLRASFAVLEGDLGVRDGAFDVVLVPDLSLFEDPEALVRRARRLVPASGLAAIASPSPERGRPLLPGGGGSSSLGYYELFDTIALQFSRVRMVGLSPFVGYAVADFAPEGEPEVSVDTSLLPSPEAPEWFLAIASEREVDLEAYAVVELPFSEVAELAGPAGGRSEAIGAGRAELEEARARIAFLEREQRALRAELESRRAEEGAASRGATALSAKRVELEAELAKREARLRELEAELAKRDERLKEVEARAGDAHVRAERLTHDRRDQEEELRRQRDRATRLSKELDDEKRARTKAELELGMIRSKPDIAGAKDRLEALGAELERAKARTRELEAALAEARGASGKKAELEAALARAEAERDAALARAEAEARGAAKASKAEREASSLAAKARAELEARLEAAARREAELEAELEAEREAARKAAREKPARREPDEELAGEVARLEARLLEQGHVLRERERELREAERIGRELVEELERARAERTPGAATEEGASPAPAASAGAPASPAEARFSAAEARFPAAEALEARLDLLAQSAARAQADLQASGWRVAQLERELARLERERREPGERERVLAKALAQAQEELARLRLATPSREASPAAQEQAALLHQVAQNGRVGEPEPRGGSAG